jgi:aspartate beta-hydroxylase
LTVALYDQAADVVRAIYDRRIVTPAILETGRYFPNAGRFTEKWTAIRDEALAVATRLPQVPRFHDIMPAQADISANDGRDWRLFIIKAYGVSFADKLARCPTVAGILKDAPEAISCSFSFVAPGKHIPRHRGPFRGILRFHLMLSMPNDESGTPACELIIDDQPQRLADGQSLLWDDTYPHEVKNRSDKVRIALLLDVWRPQMPADMRLLSNAIYLGANSMIRMGGMDYTA